jgi:hypothetical protein
MVGAMNHSLYAKITVLLVALLTAGCSDDSGVQDSGPTPDTGPPSDVLLDGPVGTDALPEAAPDAAPHASFCGTLVDSDNMKVEGGAIIICNEHECHYGTAGLTGAFCVNLAAPDDYLFHAKELKALGKHLGDVLFPLTLSAAEVQSAAKIDIGTVVMPLMGPEVKIDPPTGGTLSLGNGATLTVPAGAAVLPDLWTGEAFVALAEVPKSQLHPKLVGSLPAGVDPVATFLLVPVELTFTSPVAFALPAPAGLAAGTALDVYWVDFLTGKPTLHTDATVTAGGMITNTSGQGLTALGWLLFFEK